MSCVNREQSCSLTFTVRTEPFVCWDLKQGDILLWQHVSFFLQTIFRLTFLNKRQSQCTVYSGIPQYIEIISAYYVLWEPTVHRYNQCVLCIMGTHSTQIQSVRTMYQGIPKYIDTINAYYVRVLWEPTVHRYNQCVLCIMGSHSTQVQSVRTMYYGIPQYIDIINAYCVLWDPIVHKYNQCVLCIMGSHSTQVQ